MFKRAFLNFFKKMNDFSTAFLAQLVAGNLQDVDKHTVQQSSAGPAKKINPHNFLPAQHAPKDQRHTAPVGYDPDTIARLEQQAQSLHPHVIEDGIVPAELFNTPTPVRGAEQVVATKQQQPYQSNNELVECVKDLSKTFKSIDSSLKKLVKHFVKNI